MVSSRPSVGVERRVSLEMICPYEPGKPIEEVRRVLGLASVIKLASNENPLGPSPKVIETLNRSSLDLHTYPDCEGWYLRKELSDHLGVPADWITLGAGSAELMRLIADAYLDHDQQAIVTDICFPVYAQVTRIAGAEPVEVPLSDDLQVDLDRVLAAITPRTKVVFLASPNNPTGKAIPPEDLVRFVEAMPPNVLFVLDLAYWEYMQEGSDFEPIELIRKHGNVVLLRTFSKVYGLAGLRIGYALATPEVGVWLSRVRIPFNTSTAAQLAARVSSQDVDHVARSVALNNASRAGLVRALASFDLEPVPSDANFVLVDLHRPTEPIFQGLLRAGIVVRPVRTPRLATCLRITTGTEPQMDALVGTLREVLGSARE